MTDNALQTLTDEEIRQIRWYYQVELRPGVYTDGPEQYTAAMVRSLVEHIDLAGTQCLDIGTQEGLMAVSLARLGAETVVAYDRLNLADRIEMVKATYGVDFDYQHGLYLHELPASLQAAGYDPFDVVVFAGVLYHMIDPLAGLGTARSFVRENGLLILETAAIVSDENALFFNAGARYHNSSSYFLPSLTWLDYCLRMLRLKPIDCRHISRPEIGSRCRIAIVCRAIDAPLPFPDDKWMTKHWIADDFQAVALDFEALASPAPSVKYATDENALLRHHDSPGSVDIFETVMQGNPWPHTPSQARLNLSDYV